MKKNEKIIIAEYSLDIAKYCVGNKLHKSQYIGVTTNYYGSWFKLYGRIVDFKDTVWLPGWENGKHADEVNKTVDLCTKGGIFT